MNCLKISLEFRRKEAHRRSFPRRGQSLQCRLDRWPPLQANAPQLPVLHSPYLRDRTFEASLQMATSSRRGMRARLAQGDSSSLSSSGCMSTTCPTLAPRRFFPLRGRHGHHSHVPQADAVCQLPGVIPQRPSMAVE